MTDADRATLSIVAIFAAALPIAILVSLLTQIARP